MVLLRVWACELMVLLRVWALELMVLLRVFFFGPFSDCMYSKNSYTRRSRWLGPLRPECRSNTGSGSRNLGSGVLNGLSCGVQNVSEPKGIGAERRVSLRFKRGAWEST